MDSPGVQPRALGQALGGSSSWCRQQRCDALGAQDGEDGADDGGLAHAWTASDDQHLGSQRLGHRPPLARRQRYAKVLLHPGDGPVGVHVGPGLPTDQQPSHCIHDGVLGMAKVGKKDAGSPVDGLDQHAAFGRL
jgi:hypothetical protein